MRRFDIFVLAFIVGLCLGGCHGRHIPASTTYGIVNRGTYAYQRVNDGEYAVEAKDQTALQEALSEIGCGKGYICLVDREGEMFTVQQRKK